jgi:hypothetical protein
VTLVVVFLALLLWMLGSHVIEFSALGLGLGVMAVSAVAAYRSHL